MLKLSVEMSSYFLVCASEDAARCPDPLGEGACDPKWPTARPSWCLLLKVRLLIHREDPLALPAAELIVRHSVHSFPLRKRLPSERPAAA